MNPKNHTRAADNIRILSAAMVEKTDVPPIHSKFTSLHVKAFVGDRRRCFIGSLNLDPRSIYVNTEMGLVIEDPELAGRLAEIFERNTSGANAWRVIEDPAGDLDWVSDLGTLEWQPARNGTQRFGAWCIGLLPIKKQL